MKYLATFLIAIFLILGDISAQNAGSLNQNLTTVSQEKRIDTLQKLLLTVWLNYPDRAMIYGNEALAISISLNDSLNISKSLRLLAGVHYYKGDIDSSMLLNEQALSIAIALKDSVLISNGYNNIGLLYYNLGSYPIALEYLLKSLVIKENNNNQRSLPTTLNNIGLVYEKVNDYKKALQNFGNALKIARNTDNKDQEIYSLNNIGTILLKENNLAQAETHFREALTLAQSAGNINWGAVSLRRIGEIRQKQENYKEAIDYYNQSLQNSQSISDKAGISELYFLFAKVSLESKQIDEAIHYLNNSDQIAIALKLRSQLLDNLKLYVRIYHEAGSEKKEIAYLNQYIALRDSLYQEEFARNISLVPIKINEEEARIRLSKQEAELQGKILINKIYTIGLIISIPFIIILFVLLMNTASSYKKLRKSNDELKHAQHLLVQSEKMASIGILASGIGHEINNPLNFIQNGIEALSMELEKKDTAAKQDLHQYFEAINIGVKRINTIIKSLSSISRTNLDMEEVCDVHEIIDNCLVVLSSKLNDRISVVKKYAHKDVLVAGNVGKLYQVFLNILSNAEQAIIDQGIIAISTEIEGANCSIKIEDNGEGIAADDIEKINEPFFTTKPPGKGTGLGLFISYMIIQEHHGVITVTSELNKGTCFTILIPSVVK